MDLGFRLDPDPSKTGEDPKHWYSHRIHSKYQPRIKLENLNAFTELALQTKYDHKH